MHIQCSVTKIIITDTVKHLQDLDFLEHIDIQKYSGRPLDCKSKIFCIYTYIHYVRYLISSHNGVS